RLNLILNKLVLDDFHTHADRILLVEQERTEGETSYTFGTTPLALAPALEADFPVVERAVRLAPRYMTVSHGEKSFGDEVRFVDADFFEMFTFPLRYGTPASLADPTTVILSADAAIRYFGDENPVGKSIRIEELFFLEEREAGVRGDFTVGGVAEEFPDNAGLRFSIAANYEWLRTHSPSAAESWANTGATFIQVRETAGLEAMADQMARYLPLQQARGEEVQYGTFRFDNLQALAHRTDAVENLPVGGVPWPPIVLLALIAVFLLTLACLNFVNVALATMTRRFKEMGMRKVMGGTRRQLITQLLAENTLLTLFSLVVGTALAALLLIPAFNDIAGERVSLTESLALWPFLAALLVLVAFVSGAYPAFYVSALQPVHIFRGAHRRSRRRVFMHGFLTLQFMLAFITMIASATFVLNGLHEADRDWGYDPSNVLVVEIADPSRYDVLHGIARQQASVESLSGSRDHVGRNATYGRVEIEGKPFETMVFEVEPAYINTMGLRLRSGQDFDAALAGRQQGVVINEEFARARGWDDPLSQTLRLDSTVHSVIGVVENFHYEDFTHAIRPALFVQGDGSTFRYVTMRVAPGTGVRTAAAMEAAWKLLVPGRPYQHFFQDDVFDSYYREMRGITRIFGFVALMALLISCMGLFGLVAQHVAGRLREVGVRKVLGASVGHLIALTNRRFAYLLLLAALLATPASYYLIGALLDSIYQYHPPLNAAPFVLAYLLVFLTAALTVSTQVRKLVTVNPARVLGDN
ncbi:MAG: ABC transporter permease, partial [Dehalococcoidia bacterium]